MVEGRGWKALVEEGCWFAFVGSSSASRIAEVSPAELWEGSTVRMYKSSASPVGVAVFLILQWMLMCYQKLFQR